MDIVWMPLEANMVILYRYGMQLVVVKRKIILCKNVREFNMMCQTDGRKFYIMCGRYDSMK